MPLLFAELSQQIKSVSVARPTLDDNLHVRWHAHEGRHTAVSIMSSNGVPIQDISDTVGHKSTHVTDGDVEDGSDSAQRA